MYLTIGVNTASIAASETICHFFGLTRYVKINTAKLISTILQITGDIRLQPKLAPQITQGNNNTGLHAPKESARA